MNDSAINNYEQLITSRQIDLSKNQQDDNLQEIEMVNAKNIQPEYVKQAKIFDEAATLDNYNTPPPAVQNKPTDNKISSESFTQSFYIAYLVLLIPICASVTGLADTEQIIYGSIPKFVKKLFIGILVISILNLIYLIATQIYASRVYTQMIPIKHKLIISGIWFLWNVGFLIIGGLSFKNYDYMTKDCLNYYSEIWESKAIDLYTQAQNALCTAQCPCDMKFPFILSEDLQKKISPFINNSQMVVNISHCTGLVEKDDLFFQLKQAENNWKCSGICSSLNLYYFTDINRGMPEEKRPCMQVAIEDYLPQIVNLVKFSSLFTSIVQIIVLIYFLFGSYLSKPNKKSNRRSSRSDSDGGDSKKYSSGGSNGSGGQEIDVEEEEDDEKSDEFYVDTQVETDNATVSKGPQYFAKMFNAKSMKKSKGFSRQSTTLSGENGYSYSISSSQFMNVLRKSKLPNEQDINSNNSPKN